MIQEVFKNLEIRIIMEMIFKTVLCVVLVGLIGYNREKKGMVVGIRTHVVVGLAGLLIQLTSLEYYRLNGGNNDVFRLAGQYISGIGFLGAGTILKDKRSVKGLTTAASICLVAIIGLSVGSGTYISSILITCVAYLFLNDVFKFKKIITIKRNSHAHIEVEICGAIMPTVESIKDMFRNFGADIISIEVGKKSIEKTRVRFKVNLDDELDINEILAEIIAVDEVLKTELIEHKQ